MAPSHIFQIFLRVTVQDQICIAQWVIVDEVVQFRLLRHSHIQCILDPSAKVATAASKTQVPLKARSGCWKPQVAVVVVAVQVLLSAQKRKDIRMHAPR